VTEDGILYVLIRTWESAHRSDIPAVHETLASHLDARGVILDVRFNEGGSEALARDVAAWFVGESVVYAKYAFRRGTGPEDFTPVRERRIEPNSSERRYLGPVVVLMGRMNVGAGEDFLLMMQQAREVTFMGETSYGSAGNPQAVWLVNGVRARIPSWKAMRTDGSALEGVGIEPDVVFDRRAYDREGAEWRRIDPILEIALEQLRSRR
jgi:C-terminal processing protease CtpA/Prc